jgi:hypothetical protein
MKKVSVFLLVFLIFGFFSAYAEEEIKVVIITGISYPGAQGDYVGGALRETVDGPDIVSCFADYIIDGRLTMPLLVYDDDVRPWNGTGDYFVAFGNYITKNKVSFTQAKTTTIDFSEFIVNTNSQGRLVP